MVGSGGVWWGYLRPDQFLDHLTVIIRGVCHYRTPHVGRVGAGRGWLGIGRSWERKDAIGDNSCRFKLIHFVMKSNWYYKGRDIGLYIIPGKEKGNAMSEF